MKSRKKLEEVVASLRDLDSKSEFELHKSIKKIREGIEVFLRETRKDPYLGYLEVDDIESSYLTEM